MGLTYGYSGGAEMKRPQNYRLPRKGNRAKLDVLPAQRYRSASMPECSKL